MCTWTVSSETCNVTILKYRSVSRLIHYKNRASPYQVNQLVKTELPETRTKGQI